MTHPNHLGDVFTDQEYSDWQDYYNRRPFGPFIDNFMRAKLISSLIGESPSKHLPKWERPLDSMTEEEQLAALPGSDEAAAFLAKLYGNR